MLTSRSGPIKTNLPWVIFHVLSSSSFFFLSFSLDVIQTSPVTVEAIHWKWRNYKTEVTGLLKDFQEECYLSFINTHLALMQIRNSSCFKTSEIWGFISTAASTILIIHKDHVLWFSIGLPRSRRQDRIRNIKDFGGKGARDPSYHTYAQRKERKEEWTGSLRLQVPRKVWSSQQEFSSQCGIL